MRKTVKVNWNSEYRLFREQLSSALGSEPKMVLTRADFLRRAQNTIQGTVDDGEFHRSVRNMLAEINIKAVIGKDQVALTPIKSAKTDVYQWVAIIENGVRRILDHMRERNFTEHGMQIEAFAYYIPIWPNSPVFTTRLIAEFRKHGYDFHRNRTTVVVRKSKNSDVPRMQLHNGRTLLDILCSPVITQKRRWSKGYTHAITVNATSVVALSEPINDDNDEPLNAVAMGRDNILLVNESALQIITRAFSEFPDDVHVRQL